jgi:hypothetical protein
MRKLYYAFFIPLLVFLLTTQLYALARAETGEDLSSSELVEQAKKALEKEAPMKTVSSSDVKRGGFLLPKGQLELDGSTIYAHFSENQLVIEGFAILPVLVIGEVNVEKIKQDIFIQSFTGKFGLTDNIQLEMTVPFRYHYQRFVRPGISLGEPEVTTDFQGIGDVSGSILYHILNEQAVTPHMVGSLTFKSRTGPSIFEIDSQGGEIPMGTGFYSLKGALSFVKTADPAAVFWNIGYTYNFDRKDTIDVATQDPDTKEITWSRMKIHMEPGNTFDLGFGIAYALSYKLALSTQYQHSITLRTMKDGQPINGTFLNAGAIRLGGVWAWASNETLELSTTFGVTVDAPDVVIELRLAHRF